MDTGSFTLDNVFFTLKNGSVLPMTGSLCEVENEGRLFFLKGMVVHNQSKQEGRWIVKCNEADLKIAGLPVFLLQGAGFSD